MAAALVALKRLRPIMARASESVREFVVSVWRIVEKNNEKLK